jgi:hypothetical protein
MLSLLITLLILLLVVSVLFYIIGLFPLPAPWGNVIRAVLALIVLIYLIGYLLPLAGHVGYPLR